MKRIIKKIGYMLMGSLLTIIGIVVMGVLDRHTTLYH